MGKGMRAGKKPSAGKGGNMQKQLAQVQAMQARMQQAQEEIEAKVVETSAGGGAVSVKISGKKELLEISLKPEVVDPDDIEMLQAVGIGVAMGNATEDVKAAADVICGDVTEEGIYYYCIEHGLI